MPVVTAKVERLEAIVQRIGKIPTNVRRRLLTVMSILGSELRDLIRDGKLSGNLLRVRSGNLYRSITSAQQTGPGFIEERVGIFASGGSHSGSGRNPLIYGSVHEYGFEGVVTVRAHLRQQAMAFGLPMTPRAVQIPAHTAHMHFPALMFLRKGLDEITPLFHKNVNEAIAEGVNEGGA